MLQLLEPDQLRKMPLIEFRYGELKQKLFGPVEPFHHEGIRDKAPSCKYPVQQADASLVSRHRMYKRFLDARTKGRMSEAKILFSDFMVHVTVMYTGFHLGRNAEGNTEL